MRLRGVVLLAALALVFVSCGAGAPDASGQSEGIQVHGDWTIDIYNEDGALDQHVEFENELLPAGGEQLVTLLIGGASASGEWTIDLQPNTSSQPCPSGTLGACRITPITATAIDADPRWSAVDTVRLSGTTVAEEDGEINQVDTRLGVCDSGMSPDSCADAGTNAVQFTSKFLGVPGLTVSSGQTLQVQVDISFTSG